MVATLNLRVVLVVVFTIVVWGLVPTGTAPLPPE